VTAGTHGAFSRMDDMLGHGTSLNKFKRIKIIQSMPFDSSSNKFTVNNRRNLGNLHIFGN
jgi:hypothetical protein